MKKIFVIGNTASNFYNFRKDFIIQCNQFGLKVFALISEYDDYWIEKIKSLGVEIITYKLNRSGLNPLNDIRTVIEIKKHIDNHQPDLVFSFFTKPVIYGSLAAKLSNRKKIIGMIEGLGSPFTVHRNGQSLKIRLLKLIQISLYRIVFPFLDKIIFLNSDDPKDLIHKNKISYKDGAISILGPIGLNLDDYPYTKWDEKGRFTFIFVARLLAEKGIYEFIEAAKIVKGKYSSVNFKVIGGLDTENPYGLTQDQLNKLIDSKIIEYSGFVSNVKDHIAQSAVFVLPSYYREGVPRSTQEAMAIGRPVITTDVPGCRDTVIDGINGFLIPKWNVEALVDKMCYFIENKDQVNIMGFESYKIACEKFDVQKVNQKLFNIIGLEI